MSCAWPVPHHTSIIIPFLYYSFPGQGLALSTEAARQPTSLPHHRLLHPAMTGTEEGTCPASHLPPLPSMKATVQALLFFCLLLEAMFSFNHHSVIPLVSLPALSCLEQRAEGPRCERRGRAAVPYPESRGRQVARPAQPAGPTVTMETGPACQGGAGSRRGSEDRHMETQVGIICH